MTTQTLSPSHPFDLHTMSWSGDQAQRPVMVQYPPQQVMAQMYRAHRWGVWRGRLQGALLAVLFIFFTPWLLAAAGVTFIAYGVARFLGLGRRRRGRRRQMLMARRRRAQAAMASAQVTMPEAMAAEPVDPEEADWLARQEAEAQALADFDRKLRAPSQPAQAPVHSAAPHRVYGQSS